MTNFVNLIFFYVTSVTIFNTVDTVNTINTVNTATSVTTCIVKYQMLLLYSSKGNFFIKVLDRQTHQQLDF